jgi:competence protein ComFC
MRKWIDNFLNLIFPPRCEVCRSGSEKALCPDCFSEVKFMKPHLGIHSLSVYDGVLREAIHRMKFKNRKRLAEALGVMLVKYTSKTPSLEMKELDMIIPVPLHKKRHKERGFNQVVLLANVMSKYYDIPVVEALERIRETKAQFDLHRGERFKNVYKAFAVTDPHHVKDKRILLMDDIYTTGATIIECSKALKGAGAKRVEILTLSRATEI